MRRLNFALLASLQLCSARHHAFSIHEDLLAHPQFEVVFSESFISEADAQVLLDTTPKHPMPSSSTDTAEFSQQTDAASDTRGSSAPLEARSNSDEDEDFPVVSETYELINVPPSRYLCAIPVVAPPPAPNQTATELAKAEEAREVSRATTKGLELMSGLEGQCMYYMSGWWSYSFCYGREVVQFHAMPPGVKGGPPQRDPRSQEYTLGRALPQHPHNALNNNGDRQQGQQGWLKRDAATAPADGSSTPPPPPPAPPHTELAVNGDQRYLVQKLDSGTVCDLTGRPRTIEIQYHCAAGASADRIGWIKEVTTCTYLMMVYTPRLCADVAFVPPKPTRAHPISCRLVVASAEEEARWRWQKTLEAKAAMGAPQGQAQQQGAGASGSAGGGRQPRDYTGMRIGGVVIGGRRILGDGADGQQAPRLAPPRKIGSVRSPDGKPMIEILAIAKSKAQGGKVEVLPDAELERLELEPSTIEALRKELEALAGDRGWKLEMVEEPGEVAEIRGVVEGDDDEEEGGAQGAAGGGGEGAKDDARKPAVGNDRDRGGNAAAAGKKAQQREEGQQEEVGSEEIFFKEEL